MCVNCLSSVDAVAWNVLGAGTVAAAGWGQLRDRLLPTSAGEPDRHRQGDVAALLARLEVPGRRDDARWPFVVALLSYVALGFVLKTFVLNWVVGPLYLLLVVHALPRGVRRLVPAVWS